MNLHRGKALQIKLYKLVPTFNYLTFAYESQTASVNKSDTRTFTLLSLPLNTDITHINQPTVYQYWSASMEHAVFLVIGCCCHLLHILQEQVNRVISHHSPLLGASYLPPQSRMLSVLSDLQASRRPCPSLAY